MDALVSRASMIWLSLHPLPASEASAFNKIRAFISRCARPRPFRVIAVSCSRSSPLNRTTYFFTIICFAVMIASVARVATKANHQILSTSLKLATKVLGVPHQASVNFRVIGNVLPAKAEGVVVACVLGEGARGPQQFE